MKLITHFSKKLYNKYKRSKSRSISRSDGPSKSFSSSGTSSSSESSLSSVVKKKLKPGTPTSVLPRAAALSSKISTDEWSEISADVYFKIEQAFKMIDRDGDGKVTRAELEALLRIQQPKFERSSQISSETKNP